MQPLREIHKNATRDRILEGAVAVLRDGDGLTFARVAAAAELPERTVYRYFETREELERAAWIQVTTRFANEQNPETLDEYCEQVGSAFARFSEDPGLVRAILHSREVVRLRTVDDTERREGLERAVKDAAPALVARERRQIAAALRVLNSAPAWELLTDLWKLDASEASAVVAFAARCMLSGARQRARRQTQT